MKSEMRQVLARQFFEKKIRKVGKLIRLAAKIRATERRPFNFIVLVPNEGTLRN